MRLAFYAPMKAPDHPVPSGDREIARLLVRALEGEGHRVEVASSLRAYEGAGDAHAQARVRAAGACEAERVAGALEARPLPARPRAWLTYHLYHKAPDWIGPAVAARLGIPYVVVEASVARKQASGPWREGFRGAADALRRAGAVFCLNPVDRGGLLELLGDDGSLHDLPLFVDTGLFEPLPARARAVARARWARELAIPPASCWIVCVAMMRADVKARSFELLAAALERLPDAPWHLLVAGDGAARERVHAAFGGLAPDRLRWLGLRTQGDIVRLLGAGDLFAWPAIGESLGMAMLEAQACGMPVVAGRSAGVEAVVADGRTGYLVAAGDAAAFSGAVGALVADPELRLRMARRAREAAVRDHDLAAAGRRLSRVLDRLVGAAA